MNKLSVAVSGLGVGEQHARAFISSGCELSWVYDPDKKKTAEVLAALGAGRAASDYDAMVSDPGVAIVSIASYDDQHASQIVRALESGKHVFAEKPICYGIDELKSIKAAHRRRPGLHLESNLVLRAAPLYRWLRDAVTAGRLGRIYAFDGDYLYGRLSKITEGWRGRQTRYSVMLGGGVHLADLMTWIAGESPVSVSAAGNRICTEGTSFKDRDFISATYRFKSGLVGRITSNYGCVHRHQHVVRVFGTDATFIYDDRGARLHIHRDPPRDPESVSHAPLPESKGALIPEFVDRIRRGAPAESDSQREYDLASVCLAADCAAETGKEEVVEYV